jgi:hypothetical protein
VKLIGYSPFNAVVESGDMPPYLIFVTTFHEGELVLQRIIFF